MIEGMKFHVKGDELKTLLSQRAEWHKNHAKSLHGNLKQAQESMEVVTSAAAAAGRAGTAVRRVATTDGVGYSASTAPRRNYGGNVEDPIAAIKEAIVHHTNRAADLDFYSKHVVAEATYILSEGEIGRYELIAPTEENE